MATRTIYICDLCGAEERGSSRARCDHSGVRRGACALPGRMATLRLEKDGGHVRPADATCVPKGMHSAFWTLCHSCAEATMNAAYGAMHEIRDRVTAANEEG